MGDWVGYLLAAIYYASAEAGIAADICETFGYGYWLVDNLHVIVDWIPKTDTSGVNIANLSSQAAKDAAAGDAMAQALKALEALQNAQKATVKEAIDEGVDVDTALTDLANGAASPEAAVAQAAAETAAATAATE